MTTQTQMMMWIHEMKTRTRKKTMMVMKPDDEEMKKILNRYLNLIVAKSKCEWRVKCAELMSNPNPNLDKKKQQSCGNQHVKKTLLKMKIADHE